MTDPRVVELKRASGDALFLRDNRNGFDQNMTLTQAGFGPEGMGLVVQVGKFPKGKRAIHIELVLDAEQVAALRRFLSATEVK